MKANIDKNMYKITKYEMLNTILKNERGTDDKQCFSFETSIEGHWKQLLYFIIIIIKNFKNCYKFFKMA